MNNAPSPRVRLWAALFWLTLWQFGSMALNQKILLVSPLQAAIRLGQLLPAAAFWKTVWFSFVRILSGFFLSVFLGVLLASLSYRFYRIRELLAPFLLAVKSVPVVSFIILALLWCPSRNLSVLISFLMVLPVIYHNVLEGIAACDPRLLEMAQVFALSPWRAIRYIYLPQTLPYFQAACGAALGLCWKSGIAAEVIAIPTGSIGERLQQAKVYLDTPDLFAWTLTVVFLSLGFEKIFLFLLKRLALRLELV